MFNYYDSPDRQYVYLVNCDRRATKLHAGWAYFYTPMGGNVVVENIDDPSDRLELVVPKDVEEAMGEIWGDRIEFEIVGVD